MIQRWTHLREGRSDATLLSATLQSRRRGARVDRSGEGGRGARPLSGERRGRATRLGRSQRGIARRVRHRLPRGDRLALRAGKPRGSHRDPPPEPAADDGGGGGGEAMPNCFTRNSASTRHAKSTVPGFVAFSTCGAATGPSADHARGSTRLRRRTLLSPEPPPGRCRDRYCPRGRLIGRPGVSGPAGRARDRTSAGTRGLSSAPARLETCRDPRNVRNEVLAKSKGVAGASLLLLQRIALRTGRAGAEHDQHSY